MRSAVSQRRSRCHIVDLTVLFLFGLVTANWVFWNTLILITRPRDTSCTPFVSHKRDLELLEAEWSGAKSGTGVVELYGLKTSTEENRKGYPGLPTFYEQKSKLTVLEIGRVILNRRFSLQRNDQDRGYRTVIKSKGGRKVAIRWTKVIVDNSAGYLSTFE